MSAIKPDNFESAAKIADRILHHPLGPESRKRGENRIGGDNDIRQLLETTPEESVYYDEIDSWREAMMKIYLEDKGPVPDDIADKGKEILSSLVDYNLDVAESLKETLLTKCRSDEQIKVTYKIVADYYMDNDKTPELTQSMQTLQRAIPDILKGVISYFDYTTRARILREEVIPMMDTLSDALERERGAGQDKGRGTK